MQARFVAVVVTVLLVLSAAPVLVLAMLDVPRGGPARVVVLAGVLLVGMSLVLRALLLAAVPQQDPELRRRWRCWRERGSLVGLAAGVVVSVVGVFLLAPWVQATAICALVLLVLVGVVRALDRYADRTAQRYPVDAAREGDADRLAPGAVRETLRRRVVVGLVVGLVVAVGAAGLVFLLGEGLVAATVAGLLALPAVAGVWSGSAWSGCRGRPPVG